MQAVSSNTLIKKIDEYTKIKHYWFTNEVVDLHAKIDIIYNEFNLPLKKLPECSIVEKIYFDFILLEVKDADGKTVGVRLVTSDGSIYQITSFRKLEKDGSFTDVEEYILKDSTLDLLVGVQINTNGQENVFTVEHGKKDNKIYSCFDLKKSIVAEIHQVIEDKLGDDNMRIYQIRRKEIVKVDDDFDNELSCLNSDNATIIDFNRVLRKIQSYDANKNYQINRKEKGD